MGEKKLINGIATMVKTPFAFFEVIEELFAAHAAQLGHAELGKGPEAFDTVDVIFTTGKLVLVMMDAVMFIPAGDQAVVGAPAIGVDIALAENATLDNRQKLLSGAVFHDTDKNVMPSFVQANDGRFAAGAAPPLAADTPGAEIAFVDLDLTGKGAGLQQSQNDETLTQKHIKSVRSRVSQPG